MTTVKYKISEGSIPSLSVAESTNQANARLTIMGALGGNYIFKPPSDRFPEMPENEHVSMRMAESFGIPAVPGTIGGSTGG